MSKFKILTTRLIKLDGWKVQVPSAVLGRLPYTVDRVALNGNGECQCKDFETRCQGNLNEGKSHCPDTRCKHIDIATHFLMDIVAMDQIRRDNAEEKAAQAFDYA